SSIQQQIQKDGRFTPVNKDNDPIPLAEIAQPLIDRAHRLRQALAKSIELRDRLTTDASVKEIAIASFRAIWGKSCEKTWQRFLRRTIQRDAGAEKFDDLSLYF